MDFNPIENGFLMSWISLGLRGLLLAAIFGGIVWGLSDRRVRHIAALTWKTAVRLRFIWVMVNLLLLAVGGLPAVLRDDGSAKGMAQIILTYTLSMTTGILGLSTLWLAVGSMAQDIGQCQMQMVATKPIARWQIWLGKWLGIMGLNLALLVLASTVVYAVVEYRAGVLTTAQYERLKNRTDFQIKQEVGKALGERRVKLDEVYLLDKENHQLKLDDNQRPILQPMETLKRLLAELPERELHEKVLVARAPLELKDVKVLTASGNGINSDSYKEWRKLQRENYEERALIKALEEAQAFARAEQEPHASLVRAYGRLQALQQTWPELGDGEIYFHRTEADGGDPDARVLAYVRYAEGGALLIVHNLDPRAVRRVDYRFDYLPQTPALRDKCFDTYAAFAIETATADSEFELCLMPLQSQVWRLY